MYLHVFMSIYTSVRMYEHLHLHVHVHVDVHVHVYTLYLHVYIQCIYVYLHECTYVHVCTYNMFTCANVRVYNYNNYFEGAETLSTHSYQRSIPDLSEVTKQPLTLSFNPLPHCPLDPPDKSTIHWFHVQSTINNTREYCIRTVRDF